MPLWKRLTQLFIALATFVVILGVGGLVALDWYLGSETLKQQVQTVLAERTGMKLVITGDLGVSVYPHFGLETGPLVVFNPEGFEPATLASARSAVAKVSLLPLLDQKLEFGVIRLEDLELHLMRDADGGWNVDPLLASIPADGQSSSFKWQGFSVSSISIRGLQLDNAHIRYSDKRDGTEMFAENVRFRTGQIHVDKQTEFGLEGDFSWPAQGVSLSLNWMGDFLTSAEFDWAEVVQSNLQVAFSAPFMESERGRSQLTAKLALDTRDQSLHLDTFKLGIPELLLSGSLSGTNLLDDPQLSGSIATAPFNVTKALNHYFTGLVPPKDPGIFQDGSVSFDLEADAEELSVTNLVASCDRTLLKGSFGATQFDDPLFTFHITGNTLDFDRYYKIFIVDEPFILHDFGPEFLSSVRSRGTVELDDVVLATGEFEDFQLDVASGEGTSTYTVTRGRIWDGDATGELKVTVRHEGGEDHPFALAARLDVENAAASLMPLINGKDRMFQARGKVSYAFDMPETLFKKTTNIDEVLRHTSAQVDYDLGSGILLKGLGTRERSETPFDAVQLSTTITATEKQYEDQSYGFTAGVSLRAESESEPYVLAAKLSGPLRVSYALDGLRLMKAKVGAQLSGKYLPPGETMLLLNSTLSLDTANQTLTASNTALEAAAGTVVADIKGHRIFEKDYTYAGPVSFHSDPRLAFGLVNVEIGPTRDEKALRNFSGRFDLALTAKQAVLSNIDATFDDTKATGKIRIEDFETGHTTFTLNADALDINRYRPPKRERVPGKCNEPKVDPVPLPLKTLSKADIDGDIRVGDFRIFDISFKNLTAHATMKGGKLSLPNLTSSFYDGRMQGSFTGTATSKVLDCHMDLRAEHFDGGKFMVDIARKQYVDGDSTLAFDIHTKGATDDQFIANMNGTASAEIMKGSYRFSGEQNPTEATKPTDIITNNRNTFDFARATFDVKDGRFMTNDFAMRNSFLKVAGGGNFDLDANTIDLELMADYNVLPTTIPIYIVDCLHDPGVSVPSAEIIGNTVKGVLEIPLKPFQYLRDLFF